MLRSFLILLGLLALGAGCSREPEVHPELMRAGALLQGGKPVEAAALFEKHYGETQAPEALLGLGLARRMSGDYAGAVDALQRAEEAGVKDPMLGPALSFSLAMLGRFDEAFEASRTLVADQPARPSGALMMGAVARNEAQTKQALETLLAWRTSTGKRVAEIELVLADVAARLGDEARAAGARNAATGAPFLNPGGAVELARVYLRMGRLAPSAALLEALRAGGNPPSSVWMPLLMVRVEAGDFKGASELLPLVPPEVRERVLYDELSARVALAEDRPADALESIGAALKAVGDEDSTRRVDLRILLARTLLALERPDEVAGELTALGDLAHARTSQRLQVADLWAAVGDTERAVAMWEALKADSAAGGRARSRLLDHWLKRNDLKAAEALAEGWVKAHPDSPAGYMATARVAHTREDFEGARTAADQALERAPGLVAALRLRFVLTGKLDGKPAAYAWLEQAVKAAPPSPAVHAFAWQVYAAAGPEWQLAADNQLRAWMKVDERDPQPVVELARSLQKQGLGGRALPLYREALARAPEVPVLWAEAAQAEAQDGDPARAVELFEKLREVHPDDASLANNLAYLYGKRAQLAAEQAEDDAADAPAAPADSPASFALPEAFHADLDKALVLAEKAREDNPKLPAIADTLGWLRVLRGQPEQALEPLEAAAEASPKSPAIAAHLGMALADTGDKRKAERELKRALKLDLHHPEVRALEKRLRD